MTHEFTVAHGSGEVYPDGGTAQAADEDEGTADATSDSLFEDGEELLAQLKDATAFTESQLHDLSPDERITLAESFLEPKPSASDAEVTENEAEEEPCDTLEEALQQNRTAVHAALANREQEMFGEPLIDAKTFRALDEAAVKQALDARLKGIAKAKGETDTARAGTAQTGQSSGDPSGYGTDMFTDGGHQSTSPPTGGVFSTLAARERAQDPLGGEHPPGLFATLNAYDRAADRLDGKTYSSVLATLNARDRATDALITHTNLASSESKVAETPTEHAQEQGDIGSSKTPVNYAGRPTGTTPCQGTTDDYPRSGVFATLASEEQADEQDEER